MAPDLHPMRIERPTDAPSARSSIGRAARAGSLRRRAFQDRRWLLRDEHTRAGRSCTRLAAIRSTTKRNTVIAPHGQPDSEPHPARSVVGLPLPTPRSRSGGSDPVALFGSRRRVEDLEVELARAHAALAELGALEDLQRAQRQREAEQRLSVLLADEQAARHRVVMAGHDASEGAGAAVGDQQHLGE